MSRTINVATSKTIISGQCDFLCCLKFNFIYFSRSTWIILEAGLRPRWKFCWTTTLYRFAWDRVNCIVMLTDFVYKNTRLTMFLDQSTILDFNTFSLLYNMQISTHRLWASKIHRLVVIHDDPLPDHKIACHFQQWNISPGNIFIQNWWLFPATVLSNSQSNLMVHNGPKNPYDVIPCHLGGIARATILVPFQTKSRQLIWRSGTRRCYLKMPDLQNSCRDLTTWLGIYSQ